MEYRGLPVMAVGDMVAAHVTEPTEEHPDFEPPRLPPGAERIQEQIEGLRLFVCGPSPRPSYQGHVLDGCPQRARLASIKSGIT